MKKPLKRPNAHTVPGGAPMEPTRRALELTDLRDDRTDPLGSYTGRPADPRETPVQDADDL